MAVDRKATIIIPTKNSPSRLRRGLEYYISRKFQSRIIVADYSTGRSIDVINSLVKSARSAGINIQLAHHKRIRHDGEIIKAVIPLVTTPYVLACYDTDYAVRAYVIAGVQALDMNSSYIAAGGERSTQIQCGDHWGIYSTKCLEIASDYIAERLALYLRSRISTIHYLHRLEIWERMFEYADIVPNSWIGKEVLPSCISVMAGKIKNISEDSSQRRIFRFEQHPEENFFEVLENKNYLKSAKIMREVVIRILVEGGLTLAIANDFYNREIRLSTLILFLNKFTEKYPHLKTIIDDYSESLHHYPFAWKYPTLSHTLVRDPTLEVLTRQINLSDPLDPL